MTETESRVLKRLDEIDQRSDIPRHAVRAGHRAIARVIGEELDRLRRESVHHMRQIAHLQAMPCECWSSHECSRCEQLRAYEWG